MTTPWKARLRQLRMPSRAFGEFTSEGSFHRHNVAPDLTASYARLRTELEHALSRATSLAARLSDRAARAAALRQLGEMRGVAIRMLQIAPAPSAAATAAAESGDRAAWLREEQAWIADRLARGTNPRLPRLRRERRDTRPDSPKALRLTSGDHHDASDGQAQSALAASPFADDEDPR